MSEVIRTAGISEASELPMVSPRRKAVQLVRATLRKQDATDDEMDDALEALLELAKE